MNTQVIYFVIKNVHDNIIVDIDYLMNECQICFSEDCDTFYKCVTCKKITCYDCLEMYINTSTFLKCGCTSYILPSDIKNVKNITKYNDFFLKRIEGNFFEDINSVKNSIQTGHNIRKMRHELMLTLPYCIKYTVEICFVKELNNVKKKLSKLSKKENDIDLTRVCHNPICNGRISHDLICNTCDSKYCEFCMEIEDQSHSCNKEDILSKNYIKSMSITCPKCKLPIEKSSGCSYITCAICDTKFDHNTNTIGNHGGHSTKVELKFSIIPELLKTFPDLHKTIITQIDSIENYKPGYKEDIIKNILKNDKQTAIRYYEKYLKEQKKFKDNIKTIKNIKIAKSSEEIQKIISKTINIK